MRLMDSVEALLFVTDTPATPDELSVALQVPVFEVEEALEKLGGRLHNQGGLQLVRIAGGYQISTKAECAQAIARFLQPQKQKLSRSLMEVLAIVAYRQPITIAEIDEVRGVASDYGLKSLAEKRLVTEVGRKSSPGRPLLYGTTHQFLHTFHMDSLQDLPELEIGKPAIEPVGALVPPEQPGLPDLSREVTPAP